MIRWFGVYFLVFWIGVFLVLVVVFSIGLVFGFSYVEIFKLIEENVNIWIDCVVWVVVVIFYYGMNEWFVFVFDE